MLTLKRNAPADPVAPVITRAREYIVTEPIALMRELAITGRDRDERWLADFIQHARKLVGFDFTEVDVHPVSCCWRLDADRMHMHIHA